MQLLPRARSPSPAAVATWAFFPGHLERVERTAPHRAQTRSALVRVGFGEKKRKKKKLSRNQVPFQCPLEKCFQRKHCLGSQGKDLDPWRLLPRGKIPARMKKHASPFLCRCPPPTVLPACSRVFRTGRGTSWDSPPHSPLHLFLFLPASCISFPTPHPAPSRPCFPDTARALRTREGTARPPSDLRGSLRERQTAEHPQPVLEAWAVWASCRPRTPPNPG